MPFARHGDVAIHWLRVGDDTGEPIVLIAGLSGTHRDWHRHAPYLAGSDVVLFDNRGTGDSAPAGGLLTMADMVADVVAVMDAAGLQDAHVHGISMGGMIAQHLALEHPGRVRSLVLSATSPGGMLHKPPWRMLAATALRPVLGAQRTWPWVAPMVYAERTRLGDPGRVEQDLRIRTEHATDPKTTAAQIAAIARHDTRGRLAELGAVPVTVVHGDLDLLIPLSHGRALADGIPGAQFVLLEGSAHVLPTDDEHGLAATVREHLRHVDHERSAAL